MFDGFSREDMIAFFKTRKQELKQIIKEYRKKKRNLSEYERLQRKAQIKNRKNELKNLRGLIIQMSM